MSFADPGRGKCSDKRNDELLNHSISWWVCISPTSGVCVCVLIFNYLFAGAWRRTCDIRTKTHAWVWRTRTHNRKILTLCSSSSPQVLYNRYHHKTRVVTVSRMFVNFHGKLIYIKCTYPYYTSYNTIVVANICSSANNYGVFPLWSCIIYKFDNQNRLVGRETVTHAVCKCAHPSLDQCWCKLGSDFIIVFIYVPRVCHAASGKIRNTMFRGHTVPTGTSHYWQETVRDAHVSLPLSAQNNRSGARASVPGSIVRRVSDDGWQGRITHVTKCLKNGVLITVIKMLRDGISQGGTGSESRTGGRLLY